MGVPKSEPKTPPFEMVNVPPLPCHGHYAAVRRPLEVWGWGRERDGCGSGWGLAVDVICVRTVG